VSDLQYTFHSSHDEIPEWNEVAAFGGLYSSAEWVRVYEPTWVAVRSHGVVLAVVPCAVALTSGVIPGLSEPDYLFNFDGNQDKVDVPVDQLYPVVFCGTVRGYSCRLLIRAGLDAATRTAVLARLLEAVRELGDRHGAKLIMFGFLPSSDVQELLAVDSTLCAVFNEAECVLGPITSFDAYLASLQTERRNSTKREIKRFAAHGLRVERRPVREVFELAAQLVADHEHKFDPRVTLDDGRRIVSLHSQPGLEERARLLCAMQGETMVGVSLFILHGRTYNSRYFAAHPAVPRDALLYYNLNYYAAIRAASEEGVTAIHYGVNAVEPKVHRGCHARALWMVLDPRVSWSAELRVRVRAMAKVRFDLTAAILRKYHSEERVRGELGLGTDLVSSTRVGDKGET